MRQEYRAWSQDEDDRLVRLREKSDDWDAIAAEFPARTRAALKTRHTVLTRGEAGPCMRQHWNAKDLAALIRLREVENKGWAEIDRQLGRKEGAAWGKYRTLGRAGDKSRTATTKLDRRNTGRARSHDALIERDARRALEHASLTAAFCGDPLPGRSALDKKRAGIAEEEYFDPRTTQARPRITLPTGPLR